MHPASSVIFFSTLSGAGFGLLAWLGYSLPDVYGSQAFAYYFIGYALAVGGLLASTFHLGNKKNAIKSFREWRTSWLSREAVCAVVALLLVAFEAIARIFFDSNLDFIGCLGAVFCIITVYTTSMIYTQLKTVPRWNTPLTPALFIVFSLTAGAILAGQKIPAIVGLVVLLVLQIFHWLKGDKAYEDRGLTMEKATGLGSLGSVRQLEPPHSGGNYLLNEMGFQIGRKHSQKLRIITLIFAFIIPFLLLMVVGVSFWGVSLAIITHLAGTFASRWLFFAEAKHVVSLYYGMK